MSEPTLQQVFGTNATQTLTTLTISKTDLATIGLTASATNTAESLMVAIILLASNYSNAANQTSLNPDMQVTVDNSGYPSLVSRNSLNWRQTTYNVNMQTLDTGFTIDPDNY